MECSLMSKPTHVKPAFYAHIYEGMKIIAEKHGFNLLLHGSLNRDLDLILIPWVEERSPVENVIEALADMVGGVVCPQEIEQQYMPAGRISWLIDINRGGKFNNYADMQWYLDISLIPADSEMKELVVRSKGRIESLLDTIRKLYKENATYCNIHGELTEEQIEKGC